MKIQVKTIAPKERDDVRRSGRLKEVVAGAGNWILQGRLNELLGHLRLNVVRAIPFAPAFDAMESVDAYVLTCDLPGVRAGDLEAKITDSRLVVSGKRMPVKVEEKDIYYFAERAFGAFQRTFELPEGIDTENIKADLKDGVLTLRLPKLVEGTPRKITVQPGVETKEAKA